MYMHKHVNVYAFLIYNIIVDMDSVKRTTNAVNVNDPTAADK